MAGNNNDAEMTDEPSGRGSAALDGAIHPLEWEGKKPRASSTGAFAPIADQSNWRKRLQDKRIKFDDPAKARYLAELERTGIKGAAAMAAGVTNETVLKHIKDIDPDFAVAAEEAIASYRSRIELKITQEAVDGVLVTKSRRIQSPDGTEDIEEEVHREVKFETPLRAMILKKVNPEYRENSTLNVNAGSGGGVLVVPVVSSLEQWDQLFSGLMHKKPQLQTDGETAE